MYEGGSVRVRGGGDREGEGEGEGGARCGAVRRERCGEGLAALPVVAVLSFSVRAKSKL